MRWMYITDIADWVTSNIERGNLSFDVLPQWIGKRTGNGRYTCPTLINDIVADIHTKAPEWGCKIESGHTENIPELKKFVRDYYKLNTPSDLLDTIRFARSDFYRMDKGWLDESTSGESRKILWKIRSDFAERLQSGEIHIGWSLQFVLEDIQEAMQKDDTQQTIKGDLQRSYNRLSEDLGEFLPEKTAYPYRERKTYYDELFISIKGLARKLSEYFDDDISPKEALKRCSRKGVRVAIDTPDSINHLYMINDHPIRGSYTPGRTDRPVKRGDLRYLFGFDGMLFLLGETIDALLTHQKIREWEFSADGSQVSDDFYHPVETASPYQIISAQFPDSPLENDANKRRRKLEIILDELWVLRDDVKEFLGGQLLTDKQPEKAETMLSDLETLQNDMKALIEKADMNNNSDTKPSTPTTEKTWEPTGRYDVFFDKFINENRGKSIPWGAGKLFIEAIFSDIDSSLPAGYARHHNAIAVISRRNGETETVTTLPKKQLAINWSKKKSKLHERHGIGAQSK